MTLGDSSPSDPASSPSSPTPTSLLPLPPTPLASDTSHPSVPHERLVESSWGDALLLDKTLNNYTAWSEHILRVLCLSGLNIYLDGSLLLHALTLNLVPTTIGGSTTWQFGLFSL